MESHSDVTESTQQEDHSERENNEKTKTSTPYSKKLPYDKDLEFSDSDFKADNNIKIKQKICEELTKAGTPKFLERFPFPDIKVLVRLARRVYKEGTNDEKLANMEMPDGWQLLTTAFNNTTLNKYFGAAYWNPKEQQIVVAHRGTSFKNEGALWTDLEGILNNKTVPQMKSAITFAHKIKVIVEELNKRDDVFLQLSFTGHSLGGWLAQITTLTTKYFSTKEIDKKLLFVKSKTVGYHAHTVAFDSPGCEQMLSKMRNRYDLLYDKDRDSLEINDLDITTYLAAPNLVNTCNKHVGTLYRIFFKDDAPLGNFLEYTKKMHKMKLIEEVFSSETKDKTRVVKDWPLVSKGITERILDTLLKRNSIIIYNSLKRFIGKGGKTLPRSRDYDQYEYFHRVAENMVENVGDYNPEPDDKNGYCEIRYQVKEVDKRQHSTNAFTLEELDFLSQYKILRDNPVKKLKSVLNEFHEDGRKIEDTLKHFEMDARNRVISCDSEQELKKLIRYVKYIIRFSPGITDKIKNILRDDAVWFDVEELNEPFIGRTKELEQLLHTYILADKGISIPVITGLQGVGKSELTLKYVREYYGKDHSIIWINAENEEAQKKSFIQLHEQLHLKSRAIDEEKCIKLIVNDVYKYLTGNNGSSIFIFDNAENYEAIKKFLPQGLYNCDKVHVVITSTNSNAMDWKTKGRKTDTLKLNEFNDEEAIKFVKNSLGIEDGLQDKEINSLIQTLHNFPLALQQAVTYIKKMKKYRKEWNFEYNIGDYLKEHEEKLKNMFSIGSESEDSNGGVFSTLNVTINKIKAYEEFSEEALNMLDIISYFAPNCIPVNIFVNKLTNVNELILNFQPLIKYSIVRLGKGMLNVHGLVKKITRLKIQKENREENVLKKNLQLLTQHLANCEYNEHETNAEKKERKKIEDCTSCVVSVWNHAYKYINLIDEFLIRGRKIKIAKTGPDLSVTYFNFIAAGCKYEIVEEIVKKIEEKYPTDRNKVKNFINTKNNDKECPLHGAARNGNEQTVKLLVSKGADVNAKRKYGWTPLSLAVYNGHLSIVKYLLENKAKIGIQRTGREYTELHFASINGNVEMVKLLLSKGANEDIPEKDYNPKANYLKKEKDKKVLQEVSKVNVSEKGDVNVLQEVPKVNVSEKGDVNVLQEVPKVSVSKKNTNTNEKAPKKVSYVNAKDQRHFTALHFAAINNHTEILNLLLEDKKIDVNAKTEWGRTPLYFAAKAKNLESVKILVNKGADVNAKEQRKNFTPLHWAVLSGNKEIITYLLCREGIEIDAQTIKGDTALHLAAEQGNLQIVEILVQKDADFRIKNNDGKLASDLADENSHEEVKNYIEKVSEYSKGPHDQVEQDLGKNDEISSLQRKYTASNENI